MDRSIATFAAFWLAWSPQAGQAHEPLFMMSHEAPGKGAADLHLAIHGERGETEDETEFELEYTRGLTRNLAVKAGLPFVREERLVDEFIEGESGLGDPRIRLKWRFWDRDLLGSKYALAALAQTSVPVGERGRDRPSLLFGLSHGREGLAWYYFVDARYLYHVDDEGSRPGHRLLLDFSPGWRPYLGGLEQTDVVLFLEFNYAHLFARQLDGKKVPDSGGDFFALAPEILLSPGNRLMFKAGLQVPLVQAPDGAAAEMRTSFALETEIRF